MSQALWSRKEPTCDRLCVYICEDYAFIPREKRTKFAPHAMKYIFLGYGTDGEFGYRLWDPENRKLIRSSDVVFNEDSIISQNQQKIVGKKVSFKITIHGVEGPDHQTEIVLQQIAEENKAPAKSDSAQSVRKQVPPNGK